MRKFILFLFPVAALFLIISCASPPETVEEPPEAPEKEYNQAKELRQLIADYDLDQAAPTAFEAAEGSFKEGESAYGSDNAAARVAFEAAISGYQEVISEAFPQLVGRRQSEVDAVKQAADELKAAVAVKESYAAAKSVYDQAVAARGAGNFEEALKLLDEAERLFGEVYAEAKAKKERAEQAMAETGGSIESFEDIVEEIEGQ
jgi:tetratricopeptide (TPR) repeat protein